MIASMTTSIRQSGTSNMAKLVCKNSEDFYKENERWGENEAAPPKSTAACTAHGHQHQNLHRRKTSLSNLTMPVPHDLTQSFCRHGRSMCLSCSHYWDVNEGLETPYDSILQLLGAPWVQHVGIDIQHKKESPHLEDIAPVCRSLTRQSPIRIQ